MAGIQLSKESTDKVLEAIEIARSTGKLRKGTNEVTKVVERGEAKLVAIAKDVTQPEIVMHLPLLSKEKGIPAIEVNSKEELGTSAGMPLGTSTVAIVQEGDAKKLIKEITEEANKSE